MCRCIVAPCLVSLVLTTIGQAAGGLLPKAKPGSGEGTPPKLRADERASAIIEKVIQAYGGPEKVKRWNVGRVKYKPLITNMSFKPDEVVLEDTFQLPGHFKRVTKLKALGKEFRMGWVLTDGKGWQWSDDGRIKEIENPTGGRAEHLFGRFCDLTPYTAPDAQLSVVGTDKVNGRPAVLERGRTGQSGPVDLYFDQGTALLVKARKRAPHPFTGKEGDMETYLGDYQVVQGGQVPMRIRGYFDGKPLTDVVIPLTDVVILEVRFLNKIDESEFAKPQPR
jgi:hypothetical protein